MSFDGCFRSLEQRVSAGYAPWYNQAIPRFDPGREHLPKLSYSGLYPTGLFYTISYYYYASIVSKSGIVTRKNEVHV